MYRVMDLNGNGIVDTSCTPQFENKESKHVIPGNLGVYSGCCMLPNTNGHLYKVSNSYQVMNEPEPTAQFINRKGLTVMPDYKVVPNPANPKEVGYLYGSDGRVVDAMRNIRMVLDKPAEVGSVDPDLVGSFDNRNYAAIYDTYKDINNGQISYYVDDSVSQPFYGPVYTLSSYVDKVIRKDPMDSVKPEYIKTPISGTLKYVSKYQDTRDALSFREDLMSRQQNLYNRTSWTNRWVKPTTF